MLLVELGPTALAQSMPDAQVPELLVAAEHEPFLPKPDDLTETTSRS